MLIKLRKQMKKADNQKGFTLVELMVVVVIIGILIAIAVPVYNNITTKAEKSAIEANLRTIDGAIMQYQTSTTGTWATGKALQEIIGSDYLQAWPESPGAYRINQEGQAVVKISNGEGGLDNKEYTLTELLSQDDGDISDTRE